jgi:toxin ParE1/3/4
VRVKFLISAMEDMRSIKIYISRDNPKAAIKLIKRMRAAVKHLEEFPYSGRIIPETSNPQLREVIVSNYRVMYQITDSPINIFAVYEGHKIP